MPRPRSRAGSSRPDREEALRKRIVAAFDALPARQRDLARWVLDHLRELPFLDVPGIAAAAGASQATVVRFAQSLGFDGFAELRAHLLEGVRTRVVGAGPTWRVLPEELERDPGDDVVAAVALHESGNIERAAASLDRAAFARAVAALARADHVFTFGLGMAAHLAAVFAYLLTQIGRRAVPLSASFSTPREQVPALRKSDLVVAFSFPPYSRATVDLLKEAATGGIPTLVLTDRDTAPAARVARHVLLLRSGSLAFTNSFAAASVVLNALTTGVALRGRRRAAAQVTKISRILDEDAGVIPER